MKIDNYEETLRSFPHWLDKNPHSNFSKLIRVLNRQYRDKQHKIKSLDFAQKLHKPITIHKRQEDEYVYDILFDVLLDNIKKVNVYVNPIVNDNEEIMSYEKCFTKDYKDDGYNNQFHFTYHGDTRENQKTNEETIIKGYESEHPNVEKHDLTVTVEDTQGNPIPNATVKAKDITPIIPNDTFIIEVLTFDDYRWVKGFPENDETNLFHIYQETKSYTHYLTFEIRKENIKHIRICEDNTPVFEQCLFDEENVIYHDYDPNRKVEKGDNGKVNVAEPSKNNYTIRILLEDKDFEYSFDYSNIKDEYPNTSEYIMEFLLDEPVSPSMETLENILIRKTDKGRFNAYKTVYDGANYHFSLMEKDLKYVKWIKGDYDLFITIYDKNHRNCKEYDKIIHKRYNGFDKHNYDCFTHDYSLDMLGKWWNVPRLTFNPTAYENTCRKLNNQYYQNTYPPYNDRLTEDDYHYRKRISRYIEGYNKDYFPVLELWKNYQIWCDIRNRKDILSTQNKSYIQEHPYYEDTVSTEESSNKLNIIEGIGNRITISNNEWYESVLADNLFVVPNTEYSFQCNIYSDNTINNENEQISIRIYYLDKKGNHKKETIIKPSLQYKGTDENNKKTYLVNESFITLENAVKIDFIIESDHPFKFANAKLVKINIVDKDAMYMTTKNNYNSCVYDFMVNYDEVPTNIDFTSTMVFEKLLQRSLPLTHKGFLNIKDNFKESIGICSNFGEIQLNNLCDFTNNYDSNETSYSLMFESFIKQGCHYKLNVKFINEEPIIDDYDYIYTIMEFPCESPSIDYRDYCTFIYQNEGNTFNEDSVTINIENGLMIDFTQLADIYGSFTFKITAENENIRYRYFIGKDYSNAENTFVLNNPTFTITEHSDQYNVQFIDENEEETTLHCDGTITLYNFMGQSNFTITPYTITTSTKKLKTMINPNTETEMTYNFTPLADVQSMTVRFYTDNTIFKYKDLTITREEPIQTEELWNN